MLVLSPRPSVKSEIVSFCCFASVLRIHFRDRAVSPLSQGHNVTWRRRLHSESKGGLLGGAGLREGGPAGRDWCWRVTEAWPLSSLLHQISGHCHLPGSCCPVPTAAHTIRDMLRKSRTPSLSLSVTTDIPTLVASSLQTSDAKGGIGGVSLILKYGKACLSGGQQ